jgi:sentrin-specific protease 1
LKAPLDDNDMKTVRDTLDEVNKNRNNKKVYINKFQQTIDGLKLKCLLPQAWLNDEVINFYMNMLKARDIQINPSRTNRSWFHNTFFMQTLLVNGHGYDFNNVRKWNKEGCIFDYKKIFIPINIGNFHWVLIVVYMGPHLVHYFDPMGSKSDEKAQMYIVAVLRWLDDWAKIYNCYEELHCAAWDTVYNLSSDPVQKDGSSCGLFVIAACELISRNFMPASFAPQDLVIFRHRVLHHILRGTLLDEINNHNNEVSVSDGDEAVDDLRGNDGDEAVDDLRGNDGDEAVDDNNKVLASAVVPAEDDFALKDLSNDEDYQDLISSSNKKTGVKKASKKRKK